MPSRSTGYFQNSVTEQISDRHPDLGWWNHERLECALETASFRAPWAGLLLESPSGEDLGASSAVEVSEEVLQQSGRGDSCGFRAKRPGPKAKERSASRGDECRLSLGPSTFRSHEREHILIAQEREGRGTGLSRQHVSGLFQNGRDRPFGLDCRYPAPAALLAGFEGDSSPTLEVSAAPSALGLEGNDTRHSKLHKLLDKERRTIALWRGDGEGEVEGRFTRGFGADNAKLNLPALNALDFRSRGVSLAVEDAYLGSLAQPQDVDQMVRFFG